MCAVADGDRLPDAFRATGLRVAKDGHMNIMRAMVLDRPGKPLTMR
jgi:hypothetical protein